MDLRWGMIVEYAPLFVDGAIMTLVITFFAVIVGTLIGLLSLIHI